MNFYSIQPYATIILFGISASFYGYLSFFTGHWLSVFSLFMMCVCIATTYSCIRLMKQENRKIEKPLAS